MIRLPVRRVQRHFVVGKRDGARTSSQDRQNRRLVAADTAERYAMVCPEFDRNDGGHPGGSIMRTRNRRLVPTVSSVALALWAALATPAAGQSQASSQNEDLLFGTWLLDIAKSNTPPDRRPRVRLEPTKNIDSALGLPSRPSTPTGGRRQFKACTTTTTWSTPSPDRKRSTPS